MPKRQINANAVHTVIAEALFAFCERRGKRNIKKASEENINAVIKYGFPAIRKYSSFEMTYAKKKK